MPDAPAGVGERTSVDGEGGLSEMRKKLCDGLIYHEDCDCETCRILKAARTNEPLPGGE